MAKKPTNPPKKDDVFDDVDDPFEVEVEISAPEMSEIMIDPITGDQVFEDESDDDDDDAAPAKGEKKSRKTSSIEHEIDFDALEAPVVQEEDDTTWEEDEGEEEQEAEPAPKQEEEPDTPTAEELAEAEKTTTRNKEKEDRIRELNRQKNAAQNSERQTKAALADAQAQLIDMAEAVVTSRLTELQKKFAETMAANDVENLPGVLQELGKAQNDLAKVQEAKARAPKKSADTNEKKGPPEAQVEWMQGKEDLLLNDKYKQLPAEQRKVLLPIRQKVRSVYNELVQEGYDDSDPAFYEEADLRLSIAFPDTYDTFVSEGIDVVLSKSKSSKDEPSSADRTLKTNGENKGQKQPATKSTKPKVPVKGPGAPRGPASSANSGKERQQTQQSAKFEDLSKDERRVYDTTFAGRMTKQQYVDQLSRYKTRQ